MTSNLWQDLLGLRAPVPAAPSGTRGRRTRRPARVWTRPGNRSSSDGLVFRHVVFMSLVGSAVGCALAIGLGRLGQSLLFGVQGEEPRVLIGAAALVLTSAFLAGAIPARRAAAVNPAEALRAE